MLGHRRDLQVVAADSVLAVEVGAALADVACRLDATHLLYGELARTGVTVRVSARLLEPPRTEPLWQRDFEQPGAAVSQRAQERFRRAALLNPLSASPLERLALTEFFAGQLDAAAATARKAIALEPKYPGGHWMLGIHGYAAGDLVQAVNGYRQALERESRRPFLWNQLGWLYLDLELFDAAADAFALAVQQLPGVRWPAIFASFGWAARRDRPALPAAISTRADTVPEDGSAIDLMQVRLLGGLAADAPLLRRALDTAAARNEPLAPGAWFAFQGQHRLLNLAAVWAALGDAAATAPHLDAVERQLDELQRNGNRWHASCGVCKRPMNCQITRRSWCTAPICGWPQWPRTGSQAAA